MALRHLLHDARRDSLGRLVEQKQLRVAHQRPADCQHLLFAAAHRAAGTPPHFREIGEERVDLFRRPTRRTRARRLAADHRDFPRP